MTRPTADLHPERIRLSLEVSPELVEKLEELAAKIHGSPSDVLRRGVALLDIAVRARDNGYKIGVTDKSQPLLTEITGI